DLVARLIAQKLAEATGKNFFVENVAGAGGNVGTMRAAHAAPDGYTLLVTGGNITNNQYLFAKPGYDPLKDFDAVTVAAATPIVLAVHPSVPAKTVKELVEWIRANPGKVSYASPGTGTPPQLVGALFQHSLKLDLVHVPFDGGGTADQGRPIARPGGDRQGAVAGLARRADHDGGRLSRRRGRYLDRRGGARRHAEGHYQQASRPDRPGADPTGREDQARRHGL